MTESPTDPIARSADDQMSLLAQATVLLKWRRTIIAFAVTGALLGLAFGLLKTRVYRSSATFLPQGSDLNSGAAGLALAASQFGIKVPMTGNTWGPPVYVALLRSRALLAPIAIDTLVVNEASGRRVAVMDLLKVKPAAPDERLDRAVIALGEIVRTREIKALGAVEVTVTTPWPSVSLDIANRLVSGVQRFNVETRKSQAAAERQFVEARAEEAQRALREAEDRLQVFLQRNRSFVAPQLAFERDRLEREVALHQGVYTTLLQSREEARIREVRDTPVVTMLEEPRLPVLRESRGTMLKAALGALAGALLSLVIAFVLDGLADARRLPRQDAREFFTLLDQITPRFLRRKAP
jgi:uncharacterized protein involved in exopolysaccharide biosynthesis